MAGTLNGVVMRSRYLYLFSLFIISGAMLSAQPTFPFQDPDLPMEARVDDQVNFIWDIDTPDPRLRIGNYSVRWTGYLVPPVSGTYALS